MISSPIQSKTILLGVTGGIASYKVCDLVRRLRENGANVHVVLTAAAQQFITPLTLQSLSENPVHTELFDLEQESKISHITLADLPDLILIAPATADFLAKVTHGFCNDLLSTVLLATLKPVILSPAMNVHMWNNQATQSNVRTLQERGFRIINPSSGSLACGYVGSGRLPETEEILFQIEKTFYDLSTNSLKNKKIIITAGPTWERIDAVRFMTSPASGKTGYILAEEAAKRGADVTLISGPTDLTPPFGVQLIKVHSALEMAKEVLAIFPRSDILIATAAVSDFRPAQFYPEKVKKEKVPLEIRLEKNPDILAEAGKIKKKGQILVGFAAETNDAFESEAKRKIEVKNLDLLCANNVSKPDSGFRSDKNQWTLFNSSQEESKKTELLPKKELAIILLNEIQKILERTI